MTISVFTSVNINHVLLLSLSAVGDKRPDEAVVKMIDTDHGLVEDLATVGCITLQQKSHLDKTRKTSKIAALLLDIMTRRSVADYYKFTDCLDNNEQQGAASWFREGKFI
jgi:hypothetical protein